MSLIKCPECGKEISDQAQNCPNCGRPIEGVENILELSREFEQKEEKRIKEKNKNTWIVAGILAMLVVFGASVYYKATEPDRDREALMKAQEEYRKAADEIEDIEAQIERNQRLIDQYEKK